MILFDWREAEQAPWQERFERGAHLQARNRLRALDWWRQTAEGRGRPLGRAQEPEDRPEQEAPPSKPVLFVSHCSADERPARRAAQVAEEENFDVWLDVLDPTLNDLQEVPDETRDEQWSLAIARIIEMALANATHLTVVRTPKVVESEWVPYEYGRARDDDTLTDAASCWVVEGTDRKPEYLLLGKMAESEAELRAWLQQERMAWNP